MPDFLLEPDDLEPDRPERRTPPRLVSTGLAPTADLPRARGTAKDAPPASTSCEACGQPVLEAFRYTNARREVSLVVWCRHCGRWHWHGAGPAPGAGDGHRVAHCGDDASPYARVGYALREVGTITAPEMRQQTRRQKARP